MRWGVILCSVAGHRWQVDETSTEPEAVICCTRCGARQLAPAGSAFDRRIEARTGADRTVGPFDGH
jgi:hypothetical protein